MATAFSVRMLLFSSLFLLPISVFSQNNGRVAVGSSLTATTSNSSSWLSPSGDFAFGFLPLGGNDLFLLSIWYAKIPDKTVVWHAYEDNNPIVAPKGSTLNLDASSGLVLNNPQGGEIWKSATFGVVANGVMNDTGNFVLQDKNSGSLWETFNNPTDTILPGQTIERNGKLSSKQSESNYAKGRFQLRLQDDGNLVLNTINLPTDFANEPYFATDTTAGTVEGSEGKQLVFNNSGDLFVLRENGGRFILTTAKGVSARENYLRATLDFDGIFALYAHPKTFTGNASWSSPLWYQPVDICQTLLEGAGVGVCGYNSICKLKPDNRPTCECPKGFSFLDPKDLYRGCKPDFIQGCKEDELASPRQDLYDVEVLINTDWPTSDYVQLKPFTADKCNESCFHDCLCAVAVFRSETCWKKKLPLSNGRVDVSLNSQTFIKERVYLEWFQRGMQIGSGVEVAVKRLNYVMQDVEEFKTELNVISQTHHKNLVRLFGYCDKGQQRSLVFEFMSNGTLASFIFADIKPSWRQRIEITYGVAKGLLYLSIEHEGVERAAIIPIHTW
ncbi:hypothetical protein PS2_028577 [Malus domestica]